MPRVGIILDQVDVGANTLVGAGERPTIERIRDLAGPIKAILVGMLRLALARQRH